MNDGSNSQENWSFLQRFHVGLVMAYQPVDLDNGPFRWKNATILVK